MANIRVNVAGKSIEDLINDGTRAYAIGNFTNAVAYLSRCTEMAVFKYGEQHEKLGPIYYSYGRALLELSREDGDLLGEAVPKDIALEYIEEDIGEEEGEESYAKEKKKDKEGGASGDKDDKKKDKEGGASGDKDDKKKDKEDGASGDKDDKKKDEPEKAKSNEDETKIEGTSKGIEFNGEITDDQGKGENKEESKENAEEGSSGEQKEENETEEEPKEEDASDLQVAWEVLELAKNIFKNKGDAGREQLASTLILLGEVSLESENFENAVSDIKEGLEIQKTVFEKENRKLAETYYKLGMALSTNNQMDEAIENFNKTIEHLKYRIAMLEVTDNVNLDKDEIIEMNQLIPEIEEKIQDMKLCKEEKAKGEEAEPELTIQPSPEKKATDISHLVKRKRNLNDSTEGCSNPAKKPATDL